MGRLAVSNLGTLRLAAVNATLITLLGCAPSNPHQDMSETVTAGAVGTAVGAGTGALIGSSIKHGDVGDSALVGAGVGLASGLAIGAYDQAESDRAAIKRTDAQIKKVRDFMIESEAEIKAMREHVRMEGTAIQIEEEEGHRLYVGPTIGTERPKY